MVSISEKEGMTGNVETSLIWIWLLLLIFLSLKFWNILLFSLLRFSTRISLFQFLDLKFSTSAIQSNDTQYLDKNLNKAGKEKNIDK